MFVLGIRTCDDCNVMLSKPIQSLIDMHQLEPHPEGGFYKRTYTSDERILHNAFSDRPIMTAIHYLLIAGDFSCFHRIDVDEMWHYYEGNSDVIIHMLLPSGKYQQIALGKDSRQYQFNVSANTWFAAELAKKEVDHYALCGCTVSPGFLFETFEMADRNALITHFPKQAYLVKRLTR